MDHLLKALDSMEGRINAYPFIDVEEPNAVSFTIQDKPIKEVGLNGCQAIDILYFAKGLFESLNNAFSCTENEITIKHLETAIKVQELRTKDREKRGVEGFNKA